jgi:dolichyl-phosphate-mannose-protein mannosyltransferase
MKSIIKIINTGEFGKDDFIRKVPKSSRTQRRVLFALLGLALLLSLAPDLWPSKKTYFWSQRGMVEVFYKIRELKPDQIYTSGEAMAYKESLCYLLLVKLFHNIISQRMLCLRIISCASSLLSIFFLYLIATHLFSRSIALISVFLLATSPIYLESMRAYGYIPFSILIFSVTVYVLVKILNSQMVVIKIALLVLLCFLTLSLYATSRLVILLIIVFFSLYFKTEKKNLLIFFAFFLFLFFLSSLLFKDTRFDLRKLTLIGHPEWLHKENQGQNEYHSLKTRTIRNTQDAVGYLINIDRIPFADGDSRSRLYNYGYTAFFFMGLLLCLVRRKRSNIILLLWFMIGFFSPLPSSYICPRRIISSLPAIFLLIAIGLNFFFRLLSGISIFSKYKVAIARAGIIIIGIMGIYDIYEYAFVVTKPYYNYSRSQLKIVGDLIIGELGKGGYICCNLPSWDLIWGNPYFINRISDPLLATHASPWHPSLFTLKQTILWALDNGKSLTYLYTFPRVTPYYSSSYYDMLFEDIDYLRAYHEDELLFSRIPGTNMHYVATVSR